MALGLRAALVASKAVGLLEGARTAHAAHGGRPSPLAATAALLAAGGTEPGRRAVVSALSASPPALTKLLQLVEVRFVVIWLGVTAFAAVHRCCGSRKCGSFDWSTPLQSEVVSQPVLCESLLRRLLLVAQPGWMFSLLAFSVGQAISLPLADCTLC